MLKENRINNINLDLRVYPIYQTVRFRLSQEEKFTSNGGCSNAGLTSYALELICNNDSLFLNTNSEELNNLYNLICSEAIIKDDNTAWWRWEKIPSRDDYLYPIDWDDQFKAMDAIHSYEKRLNINAPFNLPNVTQLIDAISSGIYESNIVGEDIKLSTPNTTALYMFDERDGEKIGNKEDVFVTAVVLESAFRHGLYAHSDSFRLLAIKLFARLTHLAKEGLSSQLPFHTLSRCYISWAHFLFYLKKYQNIYQ